MAYALHGEKTCVVVLNGKEEGLGMLRNVPYEFSITFPCVRVCLLDMYFASPVESM